MCSAVVICTVFEMVGSFGLWNVCNVVVLWTRDVLMRVGAIISGVECDY